MLSGIEEELRERKARKVLLQAPEGLKTRIQDIANQLEKSGAGIFISCDPTYGGCDLRDKEAKALGCDLLVHIGHTDFGVKPCLPVIYVPYRIDFDPMPILEASMKELEKFRKVCIFTTSQFLQTLGGVKQFLESRGKEVFIGTHHRAGTLGQSLGCDYSSCLPFEKEADCFLYLGTGKFHPLGLALRTEKPVLSLDFEYGKIVDMAKERDRIQRIKAYSIGQSKDAKNFGILVTVKEGQMFLSMAERIKKRLESAGRKAWIIVGDEISQNKLLGMEFDILVNCACPRMDEDFELFGKPILNPKEMESVLEDLANDITSGN